MTQTINVKTSLALRVIAKNENSIRYNDSVGAKQSSVLNFLAVPYFSGGDDEDDPVFIDIALWGNLADKYNGVIEHKQIIHLYDVPLTFYTEEYNGTTRMKAKVSVNSGYQMVLAPSSITGTGTVGSSSAQASSASASKAAPKDITSKYNEVDF